MENKTLTPDFQCPLKLCGTNSRARKDPVPSSGTRLHYRLILCCGAPCNSGAPCNPDQQRSNVNAGDDWRRPADESWRQDDLCADTGRRLHARKEQAHFCTRVLAGRRFKRGTKTIPAEMLSRSCSAWTPTSSLRASRSRASPPSNTPPLLEGLSRRLCELLDRCRQSTAGNAPAFGFAFAFAATPGCRRRRRLVRRGVPD
jgi:hypothetical protein